MAPLGVFATHPGTTETPQLHADSWDFLHMVILQEERVNVETLFSLQVPLVAEEGLKHLALS